MINDIYIYYIHIYTYIEPSCTKWAKWSRKPPYIYVFWGTLQGTASTTPPINGNAKGVVSVCPVSE